MESYINEFITSELEGVGSAAEEVLLNRRISPYATLRPGDLATLVKFQQSRHHHHHHPAAIRAAPICGSTLPEDSDEDVGIEEEEVGDIVVQAADQGHVPAQYTVKGLRRHEMPVIGVYVDNRICTGFRYRVRRAGALNTKGSNDYFWGGKARALLSMGMGYGRRLTFQDDQLNNNECYFWSDSEPAGYAFNIHAVDEGQKFLIQGEDDAVLGEGCVEAIHEPQEEISMKAVKGRVTKHVAVALTCRITYYHKHHHGLMELMAHEDQETVTGEAVVVRPSSSAKATLQAIEGVFLPRLGNVKFVPDVC